MKTVIKTRPGMGRGLINHDPRSLANFPVSPLLDYSKPLVEKVHRRPSAYDQGQTYECVAYTTVGILNTAQFRASIPLKVRKTFSFDDFYNGAQRNDEWSGEAYNGTSGLGILRYLTSLGVVKEYRWCKNLTDVLYTLSQWGPVGVGGGWKSAMWTPLEKNGWCVPYEGSDEGGHEWELIGIHPKEQEVEGMNSWGTSWGDRGRFRMKFEELGKLLADNGDAFTLTKV